jgi:hypothetical protein
MAWASWSFLNELDFHAGYPERYSASTLGLSVMILSRSNESDSLFDRHAPGFWDTEESEQEGKSEAAGPDEADARADPGLDLGSGERDDKVEKPVRAGTESDAQAAQADREGFAANDPSDRAPTGCERLISSA